jgi:hypothetical protein
MYIDKIVFNNHAVDNPTQVVCRDHEKGQRVEGAHVSGLEGIVDCFEGCECQACCSNCTFLHIQFISIYVEYSLQKIRKIEEDKEMRKVRQLLIYSLAPRDGMRYVNVIEQKLVGSEE